jgi:hypothetical protein
MVVTAGGMLDVSKNRGLEPPVGVASRIVCNQSKLITVECIYKLSAVTVSTRLLVKSLSIAVARGEQVHERRMMSCKFII